MKLMKKSLSVFLCLLMLICFVAVGFAEENTCEVAAFLCAPSQYTNTAAYGINIDKTINGSSSIVSLGNFGGYVIYKFSQPIQNSPNNKYGIDFVVSGNAFAAVASAQEPAQVWVSEDGENWYALAGSEHYENETIWDYSVTYTPAGEGVKKCNYTDSLGDSGAVSSSTASQYPLQENYPLVEIPENELTLSGILLRKARTPSTANVIETKFGYVDCLKNATDGKTYNPYLTDVSNDCRDGMFDISWAVDAEGNPVNLTSISYIKVQTACFIDSGAFGEKSTEVTSVKTVAGEENAVGQSLAPEYIKVAGETVELRSNNSVLNVAAPEGEFEVEVASASNVYINNSCGNTATITAVPEKGVIRIIVQNDDAEPYICYLAFDGREVPDAPEEEVPPVTDPTVDPPVDEPDGNGKLSIWQRIVNFFKRIVEFFRSHIRM